MFIAESRYLHWQKDEVSEMDLDLDDSTATIKRTGAYLVYAQVREGPTE